MLANTLLLFQESDLLGWFVDDHDALGWDETAQSWVIGAVVISVICAGLMLSFKWLKKHTAENLHQRIWSRGETILLMVVGLLPVVLMMAALWYSTRDYFDVVRVGGLVKGIFFGWVLYLFLMFVGHLASPWRREIL